MNPVSVDQVIRIVATKGPVLPVQVSKEINGNTMFAGALLSQLVEQKKVFISSLKVGGSPLYYVKEQASRLQDFSKYLNEKDRKTYDLLKQGRILRDSEQSPLVRVSLRSIKDFAIPLEVTFGSDKEIFWKWYLLSEDDARDMIRSHLKVDEKEKENKIEEKKPEEKKIEKPSEKPLSSFVADKTENAAPVSESKAPEQVKENTEEKNAKSFVHIAENDPFVGKIISFLKEKEITVKNIEIKKKNSEVDLMLLVPSAVGFIEYYCKARNKKSINDSDVSSAYVQGQLKKRPSMLLMTGDVTKKARELLSKDIKISIVKMGGVK